MRIWIWLEHAGTKALYAARRKAARNAGLLILLVNLLLLTVFITNRGAAAREVFLMGEPPTVELPILMYHSVLKDQDRAGKYVVSPEDLEEDLLWLRKNGYETVVMADLINYVHHGAQLPKKPVMLTFDDGYYNNLTYALPLLQKYNMKAVVSVIVSYSEQYSQYPDPNPNYAHLSWEDLCVLQETGCFEVQNHSYDLHTNECGRTGAARKRGESEEHYREVFLMDVLKAQGIIEEHCGVRPTAFTYPFGEVSPESRELLKEAGFSGSFSCRERVNRIARDPDTLFHLGRFNRPHGTSAEKLLS